MPTDAALVDQFLKHASAPLDSGHASGTLDEANLLLTAHPDLAAANIYTAAVLGAADAVGQFLAANPTLAAAPGRPHGWDALTYLCFSRYLRLDPARSEGFVRAATALLDAGASANTGFYEPSHRPEPSFESALYGAAGVAHHPGLTRLLLERGADPNDGEVAYHAPETDDNRAIEALLESGRMNALNLATMLLRKCDWHDQPGVALLLEHGADPNADTYWHKTALAQAVLRDNSLAIVTLLVDHGADPNKSHGTPTAASLAARRGRGDVLALFAARGWALELSPLERLLAACAQGDAATAQTMAAREPALLAELAAEGGSFLACFAGVGNAAGVQALLDLGISPGSRYADGDGYWGVAPNSTALHVAAWRTRPAVVRLLLERGAPVDALDGLGRTPLLLAVRGCVDSHWTGLRTPEHVAALLAAGAATRGVECPCGYAEVDKLLEQHGAGA
ncbi:MAG: ankyrin repeat domain-containing protein [Pirellulales bacterium]